MGGCPFAWIQGWAFPVAQLVKNLPAMQETQVRFLGWEDPLEKGMATHSSILAWKIPMDRGVWQATVYGVAESSITERLSLFSREEEDSQGPKGKLRKGRILVRYLLSVVLAQCGGWGGSCSDVLRSS